VFVLLFYPTTSLLLFYISPLNYPWALPSYHVFFLPLRMLGHRAKAWHTWFLLVLFSNNAYTTRGSYLVGTTVYLLSFGLDM
jgi:hypothetical protein